MTAPDWPAAVARFPIQRGDFVTVDYMTGEFRVMAVADGYAMARRPGCMVMVLRLKDVVRVRRVERRKRAR